MAHLHHRYNMQAAKKNNLHSFPPECTMYIYMNPFCKSTAFITGTSDSSVKRDGTFKSLVYLSLNTTVWYQIYLGQNFCPTKYCTVIKRDIFASFPIPISCNFSNAVISNTFIDRQVFPVHTSIVQFVSACYISKESIYFSRIRIQYWMFPLSSKYL